MVSSSVALHSYLFWKVDNSCMIPTLWKLSLFIAMIVQGQQSLSVVAKDLLDIFQTEYHVVWQFARRHQNSPEIMTILFHIVNS